MSIKPPNKLKNIKVLIFDLDGTLYVPEKEFSDRMYYINVEILSRDLHISLGEAEKLFEEKKKEYPSKTRLLADLTGRSIIELMKETEAVKESHYFHRDPKLIRMFNLLTNRLDPGDKHIKTHQPLVLDPGDHYIKQHHKTFRLFILCNGYSDFVLMQLRELGLDPKIFEEIITADVTGTTKPSLEPFKHILTKTMLAPEKHLMIGDRSKVDLDPARKLGMKTCLLKTPWNEEKREGYDILLDTIYDLPKYLL